MDSGGSETPLMHALRDMDTLLRRFSKQETLQLKIGEAPIGAVTIKRQNGFTAVYAFDTIQAVAGLYALLEEKHGLAFVHPLHTVQVPALRSWRELTIQPRFAWRGFHLHTQHPIELTEALHNPAFPNAEDLVRRYIDWLIRNRQNYFEFCLLRSVNLKAWLPYFTRIVRYARSRGVEVGLDVSLRMQQQRAFQLLPRWRTSAKALSTTLLQLSSTGISRLNVELTTAEFIGKAWGAWIDSLLLSAKRYGIHLMTRQHVVPPEAYAVGTMNPSHLPPQMTLCVHSVMCYSLKDTLAPVYRCRNFSHLYHSIVEERKHRPVWYYPETAYWVSFDNSVPVWLLSYLRSRLEDILLVEGSVEGHLTFSSGWDIGYWLFDWSVARWSWKYFYDGEAEAPCPADGLVRLFHEDTLQWLRLIRFQDSVLVGRDGLSLITPTTAIDEISWKYLPAFQPRLPVPPWRLYRAPHRYHPQFAPLLRGLQSALQQWPSWSFAEPQDTLLKKLFQELRWAWSLTHWRVAFRLHWLQALLSERESASEKAHIDSLFQYLHLAQQAVLHLPIRYPHTIQRKVCRAGHRTCKHPHPSYRFGYLYPAISLHFWRRELGQITNGRWDPGYQNIWDIPRIIGLW